MNIQRNAFAGFFSANSRYTIVLLLWLFISFPLSYDWIKFYCIIYPSREACFIPSDWSQIMGNLWKQTVQNIYWWHRVFNDIKYATLHDLLYIVRFSFLQCYNNVHSHFGYVHHPWCLVSLCSNHFWVHALKCPPEIRGVLAGLLELMTSRVTLFNNCLSMCNLT